MLTKSFPTSSRYVPYRFMNDQPKSPEPPFTPVAVRARHDGWSAEKQFDFIEALAQCACVEEACARVGMGRTAAYALRTRSDATSFRIAWDAALDVAVRRLSDAAFSRALNGIARPVFYQGELVGERRFYDERLTMFLLRYREPARYGKWLDGVISQRSPDGAAQSLTEAVHHMMEDAAADEVGVARPIRPPLALQRTIDEKQWAAEKRPRKRSNIGGT